MSREKLSEFISPKSPLFSIVCFVSVTGTWQEGTLFVMGKDP
jgi:hypothetical protein